MRESQEDATLKPSCFGRLALTVGRWLPLYCVLFALVLHVLVEYGQSFVDLLLQLLVIVDASAVSDKNIKEDSRKGLTVKATRSCPSQATYP